MRHRHSKLHPDRIPEELARRMRSKEEESERSGVHRAPPAPVSTRMAALSFMNGSLPGWNILELVSWMDRCLIRPGRLTTQHPFPRLRIQEPGFGMLSYGMPAKDANPTSYVSHAHTKDLVLFVRRKVMDALEGMLRAVPDDRFVQAALYDGRVTRVNDGQRGRTWDVMLIEEHGLSSQVLALFAADLLGNRSAYEQDLTICSTCEKVDIWPERISRRGCPEHPEAVLSVRMRNNSGLGR